MIVDRLVANRSVPKPLVTRGFGQIEAIAIMVRKGISPRSRPCTTKGKEGNFLIAITADEKKVIVNELGRSVHIVRTMKQRSKRHRYYMEEAPAAMRILRKLRGEDDPKPRNHKNNRKGRRYDH